ncbi:unnamed protein product [Prorocentrum cordatum]|uniref:Uncharacterized protein n=1 Tax=Prorocentrum cordatum TaxID=2364126 RepID=A0ABN9QVG4_9DINO|nr:unnamed protein product [Polarella glacialis]
MRTDDSGPSDPTPCNVNHEKDDYLSAGCAHVDLSTVHDEALPTSMPDVGSLRSALLSHDRLPWLLSKVLENFMKQAFTNPMEKGQAWTAGALAEPRIKKSDDGASNEAPVAGLEQLRKALREVMGENEEQGQAKVLQHQIPAVEQGAALSVGQIRGKREKERPSSMFKALSRDEKAKHDVGVKSCAPPLGTYRPKSGQSRPRMLGQADFAKPPGRSPLPSYGGELNDPPRRPERHIPAPHFAKSTPRKAQKLTCTVNSFTAGVLDGHLYCSTSSRSPQWDFSKSVDPQAKVRSTYFQPGQYRIPGPLSRTCVQFDKQIPRPPVADGVSATNHLPDRSLSRSCPVLSQSRAVVVPDLSKYRARDAFFKPANDNQSNAATFDAMEANRTLWRKPTNVDDFDKTLDRGTSIKDNGCDGGAHRTSRCSSRGTTRCAGGR